MTSCFSNLWLVVCVTAWKQGCLSPCVLTPLHLGCSVSVLHVPAFQKLTLFILFFCYINPFFSLSTPLSPIIYLLQMATVMYSSSHSNEYIPLLMYLTRCLQSLPSALSLRSFYMLHLAGGAASSLSLLIISLIVLDSHHIPSTSILDPNGQTEKQSLCWLVSPQDRWVRTGQLRYVCSWLESSF